MFIVFFFKQKTAYEMRISDWSSDVCSSDLLDLAGHRFGDRAMRRRQRHRDRGMPVRGNVDAVDKAQIVDIHRDFGIVNLLERVDHRLVQRPARLTARNRRRRLREEARSEEHTSELQSLMRISYAVFCLKKKNA